MRLSDMKQGQVGRTSNGNVFIILSRCFEGWSSGGTIVAYASGTQVRYAWEYYDPEVEFLGDGHLETKICLDSGELIEDFVSGTSHDTPATAQ